MKNRRTVFLLNIVLLCLPALPLRGYELFRSNAAGMFLEAIPEYRREENSWVLEREWNENDGRRIESRRLYHLGKEEKTWEREYVRGSLVREKETDSRGSEESFFEQGLLKRLILEGPEEKEPEEREYRYAGRRLQSIVYTRGGDFLYRDRYLLDSSGKLLRIVREFSSEEENVTVNYLFGKNRLLQERHWDGRREQIFLFTEDYQTSRENREDGELLRTDRWFFRDGVRFRLETFPRENLEILSEYNNQERLVRETRTSGAGEEIIEYFWDGSLLTEKIRRLPGLRERWLYRYQDERLVREEKYVNRLLTLAISYPEDGKRLEEIYRNGELLAIVEYENDLPQSTYFSGGETQSEKKVLNDNFLMPEEEN